MTEPVAPLSAPESNVVIVLRIIGLLGALLGLLLWEAFGGLWWLLIPVMLGGLAVLQVIILRRRKGETG